MVISDIETGRFVDVNVQWLRMTAYSIEEVIGRTSIEIGLYQDVKLRAEMMQYLNLNGHFKDVSTQIVTRNGDVRDVFWSAEIIKLGETKAMLSLIYDYTEKKKAVEEKETLQSQLLQAQKMESVGRLAGGLAHDYNNMLSVIIGHTELAILDEEANDKLQIHLTKIKDAAQRSAELTKQLLAFARRQPVVPKIIDINIAVNSILQMLRLLIGEDIDLLWHPVAGTNRVKIDPSQFDQLLVNLTVNARDAIAKGGKITIETQRILFDDSSCFSHPYFTPGDYAVIIVSDNGSGMDEETRSKIFEPFFTTKSIGKGTGLGLSTVYGIVKQNNGFINVYSELGQGTTFKIYLPICAGLNPEEKRNKGGKLPISSGETLLVVEDEEALLETVESLLAKFGYNILAASTPDDAIRLSREHAGDIDLLMTDVVMPEMNGRELEQCILENNPKIRCLFASGYTANVISHQGVLDAGVQFIQKPFSMQELAFKVRQCIDQDLN